VQIIKVTLGGSDSVMHGLCNDTNYNIRSYGASSSFGQYEIIHVHEQLANSHYTTVEQLEVKPVISQSYRNTNNTVGKLSVYLVVTEDVHPSPFCLNACSLHEYLAAGHIKYVSAGPHGLDWILHNYFVQTVTSACVQHSSYMQLQ